MSIRLEMLQVARLAPRALGDSADLVKSFFRSRQNPDGGFRGRTGQSDLYYTVFGLDGLAALQCEFPRDSLLAYLRSFGAGHDLDFIHLCCLARCWSSVQSAATLPSDLRHAFLERIETFRARDGGYNILPQSESGTAYGSFMAVAAQGDLQAPVRDPLRVVQSMKFLEAEPGSWANDRIVPFGSTNSTAAVVTLLRNLQVPVNDAAAQWLLAQAHPEGGFRAASDSPIPDLLSTATALHALAGLQCDFSSIREATLNFIDTLWSNEGGFHGHWADDFLDVEYTFYGLLALGHLSV